MKTIFEKSQKDQHAYSLPPKSPSALLAYQPDPAYTRQTSLPLPEISEIDLMRHFCDLASRNMGIDTNFYPLGSCTMKYNPRINEVCAALPGFAKTHPLAPVHSVQGNLQLIFELIEILCDICGMTAGSLLPNAGSQGEFVGLQMMKAYHIKKGNLQRNEILIPDNAHGTNAASAAMTGLKVVSIRTDATGDVDLEHFKKYRVE